MTTDRHLNALNFNNLRRIVFLRCSHIVCDMVELNSAETA
jgi:hypothetical protein